MTPHALLTDPVRLGAVGASNRLVMAPLTRLRADVDGTPNDLLVEYYRQRASTGMIVTEGTWPVVEGRTWYGQPGIETAEHVAGWRRVTDAVHAEGGTIALQIMHGGRISHEELTGTGRIVAPSAIPSPQPIRISAGKAAAPTPHALTQDEVPVVVRQFAEAARRAMEAGFDAVQIHGANGYLVQQFFAPSANRRTDAYGGSPERRARFAIEVTRAVAEAIGADRTGIRLSPEHNAQGAEEPDPRQTLATYTAWAEAVADLGLAHVDMLHADPTSEVVRTVRSTTGAPLIANTGFGVVTDRQAAERLLAEGLAEAVGVGRPLIANPDLFARWRDGAQENEPDMGTFYDGGAKGYTDYPFLGA